MLPHPTTRACRQTQSSSIARRQKHLELQSCVVAQLCWSCRSIRTVQFVPPRYFHHLATQLGLASRNPRWQSGATRRIQIPEHERFHSTSSSAARSRLTVRKETPVNFKQQCSCLSRLGSSDIRCVAVAYFMLRVAYVGMSRFNSCQTAFPSHGDFLRGINGLVGRYDSRPDQGKNRTRRPLSFSGFADAAGINRRT